MFFAKAQTILPEFPGSEAAPFCFSNPTAAAAAGSDGSREAGDRPADACRHSLLYQGKGSEETAAPDQEKPSDTIPDARASRATHRRCKQHENLGTSHSSV